MSPVVRSEPVPFAIGDVVKLKKPHPCGSHDWTVVRLGADIGLKCHGCGRRVLLPRREVERRVRVFVAHATDSMGAQATVSEASDHNSDEPDN